MRLRLVLLLVALGPAHLLLHIPKRLMLLPLVLLMLPLVLLVLLQLVLLVPPLALPTLRFSAS